MPSWITHLVVANEIQTEERNEFIFANVMPDILEGYNVKKVSEIIRDYSTHFPKLKELNNIIVKLPNIEYFKEKYKNQMSNPIIKGYYTHLLTDYYWNNYAIGKYFYNFDKEKDLVKLKLQDGNEKICTWDEAVKIKQKDFSQFTNYLKHDKKMKTPIFTEKIEEYSKELDEFEYTKDDIKNTVAYIEELVQEENKEEKEEYSMFTKSELIKTLEENILWVKEKLEELDIKE
ncbi:MAG: hypothetical protein HFJ36_03450 [Clostridia bacterium]|nr:hypothetical protein [Clostridia bacterium]